MTLDREIAKKLSGYKQQDKKHEIFSLTFFVSKEDVAKLLADTAMKCTYCLQEVKTQYVPKDHKQWSLDRIDNRMGHNRGNVLLSCLECNLKRGNVCSAEKFRFTKQLQVVCQEKTVAFTPDLWKEKEKEKEKTRQRKREKDKEKEIRWTSIVKSDHTTFSDLDKNGNVLNR